ncbi:uncharacterized protein [Epargyreus clarus]|uniref:uncharacterized protein n=1 Tax=Epargyreus clarus TaxID=520877 RepID=UPI003C3045F2
MFYPVDSLKRGGRFYLCWVADSWPLRFATITHRQLWSQDIRKICDDLLEVIVTESGRPAKRFSLRLSSQLMRGLVRLYQRKVTVLLGDLCMINATVSKNVNKKFVFQEPIILESRPEIPRLVIELPENEERVEDMIQRSGNVVANVQDITLKEPTLPEHQQLLNDNFGEIHPDQALQLLADRTLEMMMAQDVSVAQQSLELPALDFSTDKSHDKSRLAPHDTAQMERISEHDMTMYRKSMGEDLLPIDVAKEIPEIPEISEILPPKPPVPQPEIQMIEKESNKVQELPKDSPIEEPKQNEPEQIILEELEEIEPQAKRRRLKSKIIDKNIQLSSNFLRSRINNIGVELRCEDSTDDVIHIRVSADALLNRPARAGPKVRSSLGYTLTSLFLRNLGVVNKRTLAERELEEAMALRTERFRYISMLEKIIEEVEPIMEHDRPQQFIEQDINLDKEMVDVATPRVSEDISDLPTQVIETLSQVRRRTDEDEISPKRPRRCGYISFKESRKTAADVVPADEANKENISNNIPLEFQHQALRTERDLTSMLQEAGLADLPTQRQIEPEKEPSPRGIPQRARRRGSESSETPLGSLDRTKVSLGDSDKTTDSKRFIRDQWGTQGTMIKILICIRENMRPLDVKNLIAQGPLMPGYKSVIAARCFTSILKLKQHGFINIRKDPKTLEIRDITLGAKIEQVI